MFHKTKSSPPFIFVQHILSTLLLSSMLFVFALTFGYYLNYVQVLGLSIIIFSILYLCFRNKKTMIISSILLIFALLIGILVLYQLKQFDILKDKIMDYYYQIFTSLNGMNYIDIEVQVFICFFIGLLLSIIIKFVWINKKNYGLILLISFIYYYIMWEIDDFGYYGKRNLFFYCFLLVVIYLFNYVVKNDRQDIDKYPIKFLGSALIYSGLIITLVIRLYTYIPVPFEKASIQSSDDETTDYDEDIVKNTDIYLADDSLDINKIPNFINQEVAIVKAREKVYLRGKTFDSFDGRYWTNESQESNLYVEKQPGKLVIRDPLHSNGLDMFYHLSNSDKNNINKEDLNWENVDTSSFDNYFYLEDIKITYKNLRSKTVLVPLNIKEISYQEDDELDLKVLSSETIKNNTYLKENQSYTCTTIKPKYYMPEVKQKLRESICYGDYIYHSSNEDLLYNYIKLPNDINDEIVSLTLSLTEECDNDYDKVVAIEKYLKENHKYTLSPDWSSDSHDIISEFLFETKEGFCTSFASSMVVMLRTIGFPSRLVTGYVAKDTSVYEQMYTSSSDRQKLYIVKDNNAHAWVEVYFRGFGWVPFEPTSGFVLQEEIEENEQEDIEETDNNSLNNHKKYLTLNKKTRDILIFSFVVLLVIIIPAFIRLKKLLAFKRKSEKEQYISYYRLCFRLLKHMGYTKEKQETITSFIKRVKENIIFENNTIESITRTYEDIFYGNKDIKEDSVLIIKNAYKEFKKKAWNYGNKPKYIWLVYISRIL